MNSLLADRILSSIWSQVKHLSDVSCDCDVEDILRRIKQKIERKGDNLQYVVKQERHGNDIFKIIFSSSVNGSHF